MLAPYRATQALRIIRFKLLLLLVFLMALAGLILPACSRSSEPVIEPSPLMGDTPHPLKISTASPGMVRVSKAEIGAGWESALDHPENLQLSYRGIPVPFWVDPAGGALTFYAQESDSLYTQDSVYILSAGELPSSFSQPTNIVTMLTTPDLPPDLPPGGYYAVQRFESNQLYLPQAGEEEHWFWQSLSAPASPGVEIQATDLLSDKADLAKITVALWSGTESPKSPDHHLRVLVNGQQVADERWDGKGTHRIEAEFDSSLLQSGNNQVTLDAPGDTGATVDRNYLDWVELRYPRRLRGQDDRLDFWSPGGSLRLEGFSGAAAVYDITDPLKSERVEVNDQADGSLTLETRPGRRYLAVGPSGYQIATSVLPLSIQPDLRALSIGADYVAVAPPDLLEPLKPLLDYRAKEGFKVLAAPLEAVYDQFNDGIPEPQAIQRWMQYAAQEWQPAPRFLLLVGDATYDPKGYISPPEANRLPTFLVDTVFGGQTASDVGFVQIDGDELPDLAVGRLPARIPEQVTAIVEKTLAYERSLGASENPRSVLAVADGQETTFKIDAEAWLKLFPATIQTELLAPPPGVSDAADQIREKMNTGEWLVAYFGHGSLNMWGKDRLFTAEDAAGLDNLNHLPVVLNMTCLTGLFTHPKVESLTESLLFNPSGGAVAVLAPSSLTLAYDQGFLSQPLVNEILAHLEARLGEVHLAARRQVALDTPGKRDVMMTFMLFGDPALRLSSPAQ